MRKIKLVLSLLVLSFVLSGCGDDAELSKINDVEETKVVENSMEYEKSSEVGKSVSIEVWDDCLYLGENFDCLYKLGDPISTIDDSLWNSERSYMGGELDNNVWISVDTGIFTSAHNISKEACLPEDCILTTISYLYQGADNIKKLIPNISEFDKIEYFFKDSTLDKTDKHSDGEVSKSLTYKDWVIYVYSTNGVDVTGIDFNLKDTTLVDDGEFKDAYVESGEEQIDSFRMGFDTWKFKDTDLVTIKDYSYIPDTDYTVDINFMFKYNNLEYDVIIEEFDRDFDAMDVHDVVINGVTMRVGHMKPGTYDYEQRFMCRVPDKADITIFRKGQTEEEFLGVFQALLENFEY